MNRDNSLYLDELIKINGLDVGEVKLIRHSLNHENFRKCYDKKCVREYTSIQKNNFADGYKYWMIFISDAGTKAKYYATYKVCGKVPIDKSLMSDNFPVSAMYENKDLSFYQLEEFDFMNDLKGRLIIEWGKGTIQWAQNAVNKKPIVAIQSPDFDGYEKVILSFSELADIVDNQAYYINYVNALKSVKAVYLITDTKTGKQYVGKAGGNDGLFGRWSEYVKTHHGGNKRLIKYLKDNPKGYETFQYSILQIFSINALDNEIIAAESLYKKKLLTIQNGWNDN